MIRKKQSSKKIIMRSVRTEGLLILLTFLQSLASASFAIILMLSINSFLGNNTIPMYALIILACMQVLATHIISLISQRTSISYKLSLKVSYQDYFLQNLFLNKKEGHISDHYASISAKIVNDTEKLSVIRIDGILAFIQILSNLLIGYTILVSIDFTVSIAIVFMSIMILLINTKLSGSIQKESSIRQELKSRASTFYKDFLIMYKYIILNDLNSLINNEFDMIGRKRIENNVNFMRQISPYQTISRSLINLSFVAVLYITAKRVVANDINIGEMVVIIQLLNLVLNPFGVISTTFKNINEAKGTADRLIKMSEFTRNRVNSLQNTNNNAYISFNNVAFSYSKRKDVIKNVSLSLKKNETISITGASGEGKSTIVKLLLGIIEPDEGTILITGKSLYDLGEKKWKDQFAYISQSQLVYLNYSIRENICFGLEVSEKEIERVLSSVRLDILPRLDEIITHEEQLSMGERRRLAISRAILKGSPIFILDEITSSLDNETKIEILDMLFSMSDKTLIFVSHDDDVSDMCDEKYILCDGLLQVIGNDI